MRVCMPIDHRWVVGGSGEAGVRVPVATAHKLCLFVCPDGGCHGPIIWEYVLFRFCWRFDVCDKISAKYFEKFWAEAVEYWNKILGASGANIWPTPTYVLASPLRLADVLSDMQHQQTHLKILSNSKVIK